MQQRGQKHKNLKITWEIAFYVSTSLVSLRYISFKSSFPFKFSNKKVLKPNRSSLSVSCTELTNEVIKLSDVFIMLTNGLIVVINSIEQNRNKAKPFGSFLAFKWSRSADHTTPFQSSFYCCQTILDPCKASFTPF